MHFRVFVPERNRGLRPSYSFSHVTRGGVKNLQSIFLCEGSTLTANPNRPLCVPTMSAVYVAYPPALSMMVIATVDGDVICPPAPRAP